MEPRLDLFASQLGPRFLKRFNAAHDAIVESDLPANIQALVKIRASQINGCGFCTDMHIKDACHAGESQQRLHLVAAWRDAKVFTAAERAALALTEDGTRIADADTSIAVDVWDAAGEHFDDEQLAALVALIAMINAYNRLNVLVGTPAGDYVPGQFG